MGETLDTLATLQEAGQIRHIGLSNFPPSLVEQASQHVTVFCNEVEYHPYLSQHALHTQACRMDYLLIAYCPLAQGRVVEDPILQRIGQALGRTASQVNLRWLIQQDHVAAIPKATRSEHRSSNLDIFDFELSDAQMTQIHDLNEDYRMINPVAKAPDWER